MAQLVQLPIGDTVYPLYFSTNAAFQLDKYLRQNSLGNVSLFMARMLSGQGSMMEIHLMLWACIEGGRAKAGTRAQPYTIEDVGNILDEGEGGALGVAQVLQDVLAASVSKPDPNAPKTDGETPGKNGKAKSASGGKRSSLARSA